MRARAIFVVLLGMAVACRAQSPLVFPRVASEEDCGACQTNSPVINPVMRQRVSLTATLKISTNGLPGLTKYLDVYTWPHPTGRVARVMVPEPTGIIAIRGRTTNGAQSWWDVKGWSNVTQVIPIVFTNTGPMGFFFVVGANE